MTTRYESRRWLGGLGALVVVSACTVATAAGAAAADDNLMEPNEAWVVRSFVPGAPVDEPEDGRLRGLNFTAEVFGISEALAVERDGFDYKPSPGQKIVVAGVKFARYGEHQYDRPIRATAIVDGRRIAVDYFPYNLDGGIVAVSVPLDAKEVVFELAAAESAQTFSMTGRKRVGFQPVVLYRDPAAPEVKSDVNADRVVRASDDRLTASVSVTLERVRLSWFSPSEPMTTPSSADRAYLVLEAEAEPEDAPDGSSFDDFGTVPAPDVRLRLSDGTEVEAMHTGETDDLLSGTFYFEVPADLTTATVLVGPTTVPALRRGVPVTEPTHVRIERAAFDVSLPPGNPPVRSDVPTNSVPATNASDRSRATVPAADESGGGGSVVWPVLLVLALGVVGSAFVGQRRRRSRTGAEPGTEAAPSVPAVDLLSLAGEARLAVGGPGAVAAVRAALVAAGTKGASDVVVLARDETADVVPENATAPWLTVARDDDALFAAVEVAALRQARLDDEYEPDAERPEERPLLVVVPASLDAPGRLPARHGLTVVSAGEDAEVRIDADGHADGDGAPRRVALMTEEQASALLGGRPNRDEGGADDSTPPTVDAGSPTVVHLRLLGPYRVTTGAREVASGLRAKARELLALLAVNRDGLTADAAMEALWPGAEPDPAYFRTVVANLRGVLRTEAGLDDAAAVVERAGQRYRLDPASVDVDLWRFEDLTAAARGDDAAAEAAADTYRGNLLDGEDFPWADSVRERLRRRAVDNLTSLAERRRAAGDLDGALHAAERAVELDPYAEELHQRVMRLYHDLGRPDGARRVYEALAARLGDLGSEPNAESRALGSGAHA